MRPEVKIDLITGNLVVLISLSGSAPGPEPGVSVSPSTLVFDSDGN